jgi:biopolymer transport protein ExbB
MGLAQAKAGLPANAGTRLVAGYQIRLGSVYSSFVSTEGPDVAILGKTGKLQENAWTWLEDLQSKDREVLQAASSKLASQSENVIMLPVDVQLRKATGAGYTAGEGVSWYKELLNELKGAGFVIYLLGVILFIGLSILTDKMIVFFTRGRNTRRFAEKVIKEIESGRDEKALSMCRKAQGSVPLVMGAILKNRRKGRGAAEDNAYEVMLIEGAAIEKRISTINILAAAAPLVGLLGTVSGMVNLFSAITMHGTNDPKIMAAGIGEALLSTKWGLLVAIPMLLLYNFISNKATALISDIEKYSAKTINTVFGPPDENDEDGRQQMIAEKDRNDSGALPKEDNKPNTNEGGAEPLNA